MVTAWIQSGIIQDPFSELFIQRLDNVRLKQQDDLKIDWDNEFKLRSWVDKANKECIIEPKIIRGKAQKILDAGKSVRLSLYLRSNPQNSEIIKLVLEKPNIHEALLEELNSQLQVNFETVVPCASLPAPLKLKSRPTFNASIKNELYTNKKFSAAPPRTPPRAKWGERRSMKMDNELEDSPDKLLQDQYSGLSLFSRLTKAQPNNTIVSFKKKKYKIEPIENHLSSQELGYQDQIARKISQLVDTSIKMPQPGFTLHKSIKEAYSKSINTTSSLVSSNLGHLLHSSFDIGKIMRTVRYLQH